MPGSRTVEGDLGMRWNAVATPPLPTSTTCAEAAARRAADPAFLPSTDQEHEEDERLARAAAGLALRRHAGRSRVVVSPEGRVVERSGKDLREVRLLVGSGGVLRDTPPSRRGCSVSDRVGARRRQQLPAPAGHRRRPLRAGGRRLLAPTHQPPRPAGAPASGTVVAGT